MYTTVSHLSNDKIKKGVPDLDFEIFRVKVKITKKLPKDWGGKWGVPQFRKQRRPLGLL